MSYVKTEIPDVVYHLTTKEKAAQILVDGKFKRFGDSECWFCRSIHDLLRYMEYTVLCEGKQYIAVGGIVKRYPKFIPDDYVVLKAKPKYREGNWYKWKQELPPDSSPELIAQGKEFSDLKIGFRGDLRYKDIRAILMNEILDSANRKETEAAK